MVTKTLLETIFPSVIVDNFDIVSIQHYPKDEEIHIHLDEKKTIPVEFSSRRVIFHGFTSAKKIQDYPIRGNAVWHCLCYEHRGEEEPLSCGQDSVATTYAPIRL